MTDDEAIERYRNNQLNKYLDSLDNIMVSNCCGEELEEDSDICSLCKKHCEEITMNEFSMDKYESAMEDKADAERELQKENR